MIFTLPSVGYVYIHLSADLLVMVVIVDDLAVNGVGTHCAWCCPLCTSEAASDTFH